MAPFLANLRPRSLPRTKHHIPAECNEDEEKANNINITAYQRPRSQIQDQSSSFLANLRPRSTNNDNDIDSGNFPGPRSHNSNDFNFDQEPAAFSANFRPRSHSSQEENNPKTYLNNNSQETSFSRLNLWSRSKSPRRQKNNNSNNNTKPQESTSTAASSPRSQTNSQESSSSTIRRSQASSQDTSSSRLRPRSQTNSQESTSSTFRPRSHASSQDKSSSRLRPRPQAEQSQEAQESMDRPRSPTNNLPNIPFLSNLRTRARSVILEDQLSEDGTLKPRFATDMPGGTRGGAGLPRRRSRRVRRAAKNNTSGGNSNDNGADNNRRTDSTDSTQFERAHLARLQLNASNLLKRAIKRVYVKKNILHSLKELDALIHYAELDLRTIPVVSKRILGIQSVNNIVVEKQLQAASYLYSLRKKPENEAVKRARNVMNSAACLLDNDNNKEDASDNDNSNKIERYSKMERALCVSANDLGEMPQKSCSVREQVLELLVLTTRKRAEIEIKAVLSGSNCMSRTKGNIESDESITSESSEGCRNMKDTEKESHSPKCVRDSIITAAEEDDDGDIISTEQNANINIATSFSGRADLPTEAPLLDRMSAALLISRSWKMKKLQTSNALACLMRLRTLERHIVTGTSCASLQIFDNLITEARLVLKNIDDIADPDISRVVSSYTAKDDEKWDRIVSTSRRNSAISTVICSINLWRIRKEGVKDSLSMIETIVNSAFRSNTETGYENALGRLATIDELRRQVVRRKVISGRNILLQKQRQLRRSSKRISELRAIEKQAEIIVLEKQAAESKADDYMNWWTEYGTRKGQLRILLATLHRILPEWNRNIHDDEDSNCNMKKMYRKALLLVHPDRLAKAKKLDPFDQVLAQKIFVELQQAYDIFVENEKLLETSYCASNFG